MNRPTKPLLVLAPDTTSKQTNAYQAIYELKNLHPAGYIPFLILTQ